MMGFRSQGPSRLEVANKILGQLPRYKFGVFTSAQDPEETRSDQQGSSLFAAGMSGLYQGRPILESYERLQRTHP